ncbi:MAG: hypothetical protein KJ919_06790, partial [Verrucomicrobia bacterium]|nr:hypothetical protein [Verrucomicrobiota bacterium]
CHLRHSESTVDRLIPVQFGSTFFLLPEYCAKIAQYSLFVNADKALAKRRRVGQITQWVIRSTQVVNPL